MGKDKADLLPGALDLLVLKTVETMGPIHGWGMAKRIEQVPEDLLEMKYGTLYPAHMKVEQNGWISSLVYSAAPGRPGRKDQHGEVPFPGFEIFRPVPAAGVGPAYR